MKAIKTVASLTFYLFVLSLTACSAVDAYIPKSSAPNVNLPVIPEIKRQVVRPVVPKQTQPTKVIRSSVIRKPIVKPYFPKAPQKKAQVKKTVDLETQKRLREEAKQRAIQNSTVDIDPFANVPESRSTAASSTNTSTKRVINRTTSPAVNSLMVSARADIVLGRNKSAVTKLERALRIEPQNAMLWHMLAKSHFGNSAYLHAISMAKRSNTYTSNRQLINENWKLIRQAGERSDNAVAIKEALDYMKLNP